MLLIALLAAAVVGAPTPETATTAAAATAGMASTPAPAKADDEMVCKQVQTTGTRFSKKVCFRKSEMAEEQYRQRQAIEAVQRSRNKMD